jgi:cytochrome c553
MTLSMPAMKPSSLYCLLIRVLVTVTVWLSIHTVHADTATVPDTIAQRMMACSTCHGVDGRASSNGFYPRIAGKPEQYLYNQLLNFKQAKRQYPAMTFLLENLSDDYLREVARYYSQQHPPYVPPQAVTTSAAVLARGRELAIHGDKTKNIPACIACHGSQLTGISPALPGLVGLPRDYLNAQFGSWKSGSRKAQAPDCMAQITARMSLEDINAVSSWLAAQAVPANSTPEPRLTTSLPLSCGSVE